MRMDMSGLLITLQFWGVAGIIIGLVLGFVGVVPLAKSSAAAVHREWVIVAELNFWIGSHVRHSAHSVLACCKGR